MTSGRNVNSVSKEWGTPPIYVDAVKEVFGGEIDLDPCSNKFSIVNAKVEYSLPRTDGLQESWGYERIYVNPPYGKDKERGTEISDWLNRCAVANETHGSEVIALLPTAANTSAWKNNIWGKARMICYLYDTRLKFLKDGKEDTKGSPIQNCIVYWGTRFSSKFEEVFLKHGAVVDISSLQTVKIIGGVENLRASHLAILKKHKKMKSLAKSDLISLANECAISSDGTKTEILDKLLEYDLSQR